MSFGLVSALGITIGKTEPFSPFKSSQQCYRKTDSPLSIHLNNATEKQQNPIKLQDLVPLKMKLQNMVKNSMKQMFPTNLVLPHVPHIHHDRSNKSAAFKQKMYT
jgi:hypothetical protein